MQKEQEIQYFLGIDWGARRTGFALADNQLKLASALGETETKNIDKYIEKLKSQFDFQTVILGFHNFGEKDLFSSSADGEIQKIKTDLEKQNLKVILEAELFSSKLAQRNLQEAGVKNSGKKDNAEAARIILQSWLDKQS